MPFYRYRGKDPTGKLLEGTVEASDPNAAVASLRARGWQVLGLSDAPRPAARSTPSIAASTPQASAKPRIRQTRWGRDKDLHFIFAQVGSYLRAGVNPVEAFEKVGRAWRSREYREALLEVGRSAVEGQRISDALAQFPYLFPPHVVGMFRVGEDSGQMPEACETISWQAMDSHKYRKLFWWLWASLLSGALFVPAAVLLIRSLLDAWKMANGDPSAPGLVLLGRGITQQVVWPTGSVSLAALLLLWVALRVWLSMPNRPARHRLVLRLPAIGKRAWAESMALFAWGLATLSRTGIAPRDALAGAAAAMPNLALRNRIEEIARGMSENTRLSEAFAGSHILPPEFVPLAATGEAVGDVAGQMAPIVQAMRAEFEDMERWSKTRVGCWTMLLVLAGIAFLFYLIYGVFYGNLFQELDMMGG